MRLVATSMVALEVFFLKLKLFIHTGIAGGLFALKLQEKARTGFLHPILALDYYKQTVIRISDY